MSKTLIEIAQDLKDANKKVQLIYAFNGTGKTRLSRAFKELIAPKNEDADGDADEEAELSRDKILYYNAYTEDLFYWENDLTFDSEPKLKIQPNSFTEWILKEQGKEPSVIANFQRYANDKLTPSFSPDFKEVTYSIASGDDTESGNLKISKGEESNFIWSIFYTLLDEIILILNEPKANRDDDQFDKLEFVFVDDPVSSLDDNHLIELAVDLAMLVKSSESELRFIITTHNPLFYNVLNNELNNKLYKKQADGTQKLVYRPKFYEKYQFDKNADGSFEFKERPKGAPFSYHLFLLSEIQKAISSGEVRKYHFSFMRNILEKTATFLGHSHWPNLLAKNAAGQPNPFANRILNLSSHSAHSGEEIADVEGGDKEKLRELVEHLAQNYGFKRENEQDD